MAPVGVLPALMAVTENVIGVPVVPGFRLDARVRVVGSMSRT